MDERLFFQATERNRGPIGEVLSKILPSNGFVLEIASGSGEHGVTFKNAFPIFIGKQVIRIPPIEKVLALGLSIKD